LLVNCPPNVMNPFRFLKNRYQKKFPKHSIFIFCLPNWFNTLFGKYNKNITIRRFVENTLIYFDIHLNQHKKQLCWCITDIIHHTSPDKIFIVNILSLTEASETLSNMKYNANRIMSEISRYSYNQLDHFNAHKHSIFIQNEQELTTSQENKIYFIDFRKFHQLNHPPVEKIPANTLASNKFIFYPTNLPNFFAIKYAERNQSERHQISCFTHYKISAKFEKILKRKKINNLQI